MTRYTGKVSFEISSLGGLCVEMEVPSKVSLCSR